MRSILCPLFAVIFLLAWQATADCPSTNGFPTWASKFTSTALRQNITVNAGETIVLDSSPSVIYSSIVINGTLIVKDADIELRTEWIKINAGGSLLVGGSTCPITKKVVFTFYGSKAYALQNVIGTELEEIGVTTAYGYKGLVLTTNGTLSMWGYTSGPSWTQISQTVNNGSTTVQLKEAVKWRAGDDIIVTSTDFGEVLDRNKFSGTDYPGTGAAGTPDQTERRTIQSISADGKTITLTAPLTYTHWGKDFQFAEVGLLTRRIVIQSSSESDADGFGGHFMMRKGKKVEISGIEVTRMGQRGVLARYPVHFHNMRFVDDIKPFIRDSSIHDNFQRCLVVHESHGVTIKDNVAYNTTGHCYFIEDGGEHDNVFEHNLGAYARPIGPFGGSEALLPTDNKAAVFWITNPQNNFTRNVAVGGFHGFWFAMPERPRNLGAKYWDNGVTTMEPRKLPLISFDSNIAHSNRGNGLHIDDFEDETGNPELASFSPPRDKATFYRFISYKNRVDGIWGKSSLEFAECVIQDNNRAFMVNGRTVLRDSLISGETDNIGNPYLVYNPRNVNSRTYPDRNGGNSTFIQGHSSYDNGGPQYSLRNHFTGFKSTPQRRAAALVPLLNGPFMLYSKNHFGHELTFDDDVNRVWVNYGTADVSYGWNVLDADGSVTGISGGAWIQSNESISMRPGCEWKADWNTYVCPHFGEGFVQFTATAPNGVPANATPADGYEVVKVANSRTIRAFVRPLGSDYFTGPKGGMQGATPSGGSFQYMHNVISRRAYSLDFYAANGDASYTPNPLIINMAGSHPGDWVIFALPYPVGTTFSTIRGNGNLTQVNSFEALNLTSYFYDSKTKHFYFMIQNTNLATASDVFGFKIPNMGSNNVFIEASCGDKCQPALQGVPAAIPLPKGLKADTYVADLDPCQVPRTGSQLGKAFFYLHPSGFGGRTELHFKIYHDLVGLGNKISLAVGDVKTPGADIISQAIPIGNTASAGVLYPSREQWEKLAAGKLFIKVVDSDGNQILRGQILCTSDTCTKPPKSAIALSDVCKPAYSTLALYSNGNFTKNATRYAFNSNYTMDLGYTESVLCGSSSLKIGLNRNNNMGVGIQWPSNLANIDLKQWKSLEFFIKLETEIATPFSLLYYIRTTGSGEGGGVTVSSSEIDNLVITNSVWSRVRIPLSRLNVTSLTTGKLRYTYFQYNGGSLPTDIIISEWRLTDQEALPITEESDVTVAKYGPVCVNDTNDQNTQGTESGSVGQKNTFLNVASSGSYLKYSVLVLLALFALF